MGILQRFLEILRLDEPKAVRHLDTIDADQFCALEQERLNIELERDCYKLALKRKGFRDDDLALLVASYRRSLMKAA